MSFEQSFLRGGPEQSQPEKEPKNGFQFVKDKRQRELLAEAVMRFIDEVKTTRTRNLVFMDTSARPVSTLFLDLWKRACPGIAAPHINFLKTSSVRRWGWMEGDSTVTVDELTTPQEIARIQKEYTYLADAPLGSRVMIIDEYSNSGSTLAAAETVLKVAFPYLRFEGRALAGQSSESAKTGELELFEEWTDPVRKVGGQFNPPWRNVSSNPRLYGITGVLSDDDPRRLTARPASSVLTPERMEKLHQEYSKEQKQELARSIDMLTTEIEGFNKIVDFLDKTVDFVQTRMDAEYGIVSDAYDFKSFYTEVLPLYHSIQDSIARDEWENVQRDCARLERFTSERSGSMQASWVTALAVIKEKYQSAHPEMNHLEMRSNLFDKTMDFMSANRLFCEGTDQKPPDSVLAIKSIIYLHDKINADVQEPAHRKPDIRGLREEMHMIAENYWNSRKQ